MRYYFSVFIITILLLLTACNANNEIKHETPPTEDQLPQIPNCAADGPGCKQFNPALVSCYSLTTSINL